MRELVVQGVSGQLNESDRAAIQLELNALKEEVTRIGELSFNGKQVFGEQFALHLSAGSERAGTLHLNTQKLSSAHLGHHVMKTAQHAVDTGAALGEGALSIITREGKQVFVRETTASDDELSTVDAEGSAIAKAAAINATTHLHGVTAVAQPTVAIGLAAQAVTLDESNYLILNGEKISGFEVQDNDVDGNLLSAINAVSEETGVVATIDGAGRVVLTAQDGRNIHVEAVGNGSLAGLAPATTGGTLQLISDDTFTLRFADNATNEAIGELVPPSSNINVVSIADGSRALSANTGQSGISGSLGADFTLDGVDVGSVTSIHPNESKDLNLRTTGDLLTFEGNVGQPRTLTLNQTITGGTTATIELNILSLSYGVMNLGTDVETSGSTPYEAPDGSTENLVLQVSTDGGTSWTTHSTLVDSSDLPQLPATDPSGDTELERLEAARIKRTVTSAVDYQVRIAQLTNSSTSSTDFDHYGIVYGAIELTDDGFDAVIGESYAHSLETVEIESAQGQRDALRVIDQALSEVTEAQVTLGALQNRLESSINALSQSRVSALQARSQIRDADYAAEVAELSRAQLTQQASVSVLSRLAEQPSLALALLG
jgi:flagellin